MGGMITVFVFDSRPKAKAKVQRPIEKNPLVKFFYPSSKSFGDKQRLVRLISANGMYVVGLEISNYKTPKGEIRQRHQFKKFRQSKVQNMQLVEFAPESMS